MKNKRIDLRAEYAAQIEAMDWPAIVAECRGNLAIRDGCLVGLCYLGSVFSLMPSGKYYTPWCSNQTWRDAAMDSAFMELLESAAEAHGLCIESGEGDPCDMFATMYMGDYYVAECEGDSVTVRDNLGNEEFSGPEDELRAFLEDSGHWPDIVVISDHGDVTRYNVPEN